MSTDTDALQWRAFTALDDAGIRWAVLRDDPLDVAAADIDLLVHPADVDRLDGVLAPLGYARLATWRHGDHRFHFAYDEVNDRWAKLDTVSRLEYRSGRELPKAVTEGVLLARARVDRVWRVSPADEFWALLLHCLLDRGTVAARHLRRLAQLAESDPAGPIREALEAPTLAATMVGLARAGSGERIAAMRGPLGMRLARPSITSRVWRAARGAAAPILKAVLRPGISVVIMGPDGAGKSTLSRSLSGTLPVPVRTRYAGLYGGPRKAALGTGIPGVAIASQLAAAWVAYGAAAYDRRRGRFTVFDRYGYDALLPSERPATPKRRIRTWLLGRVVPRPNLVLVLDAPVSRLHARKAEHDLATVERRRAAYLDLAHRLADRVSTEVIDTNVDQATVRRRATALIWRAFARRSASRSGASSTREYNRAAMHAEEVPARGDR